MRHSLYCAKIVQATMSAGVGGDILALEVLTMRTFLIVLGSLAATSSFAASNSDYIALGDSIAFGFQPIPPYTTTASYADQGYVKYVANYIGGAQGGVRPNVFNLAVPDETSSSFFDTSDPYRIANLNYTSNVSQMQLFNSTVASETGLGHTVSTVSFALGANDLLNLLTPAFLAEAPALQFAQVNATLGTIQANVVSSLTDVRALAPAANLVVVGYYNPFDVPQIPVAEQALTDQINNALNFQLSADASAFGGTFVDVQSAFAGHIGDYTWMETAYQDIHPNDLGYKVIGEQIKPAVAPAPAATFSMLTGLAAFIRRRRK